MHLFKKKSTVNATVYNVSPHGIYVNIISDKIQAKITVENEYKHDIKIGDIIPVKIIYLNELKIIIEMA